MGQAWGSEWLKPEFHGFISQTVLKTTERDYLIKESSKGSFNYSEMGLNISGSPEPRYRYSLQILFREFGEEGEFEPTLDFGFLDARLTDQIGVRVGKVRFPLGSQNEYRDVDAGRITLLPQQSIYPESFRPLMINVQGLDFYGHHSMSDFGELTFRLYGGSLDINDDFFFTQRMRTNLNSPTTEIDGRRLGGAWIGWENPEGNLLVHASMARLRGFISLDASNVFAAPAMEKAISLDVDSYIYGFEYLMDEWTLSAEFNHFQPSTEYTDELRTASAAVAAQPREINGGSDDSYGWYISLSYDHPGPMAGALSFSDYVEDTSKPSSDPGNHREAITLSLRYDFSENFIGKAEFHRFDGRSAFKTFANNPNSGRIWTLSALRLTYSF